MARISRRWIVSALHFLFLALLAPPAGAASGDRGWELYSSDSFTLQPRESFQIRVDYDQIPVRSWKLVVTGADDRTCDLSVLRVNGEELLYYKIKESRHEVQIPWGKGEKLIITITNREAKANFVVELLGPPRDQVHASYSYHVNRALEYYAAGRRLAAEEECREALVKDPEDGVAKVLLAGFLRDHNDFDRAASLIQQALEEDLSPEMRQLALDLRAELAELRAPLPPAVREGVERAEDLLESGDAAEALVIADGLLAGDLDLDGTAKSRLDTVRGRALHALGRNFEAVDAYTRALQHNRNRAFEAIVYFHMGNLYRDMENPRQAVGAYTIALQYGLPSGLDVQARESLKKVSAQLPGER